jgi:dipeptidase
MLAQILVALAVLALVLQCQSCSNFLASKGATHDSSTIIAYNADSSMLYGQMYSYPAKKNIPAGTMRQIYDWSSGAFLGEIPEAAETYNVIGNTNEFGLVIGETTFGGIEILQSQKGAMIDYASLEYLALTRSKTARQAIQVLDELMQTYGYFSEGESFSIADGEEVWIMEIIGKGNLSSAPNKLGSVWVAKKLPDGAICAHANQARITTFAKNSPEDTLYAHDVISFARDIGLYAGSDDDFSFSDVYDPVTFGGARFCEARVWSMYGKLMGAEWMATYESYATGRNITNRMPLFVTPPTKVSTKIVMEIMRDHYEGTALDMTGTKFADIGADSGNVPYRVHPLTWTAGKNNEQFFNERSVGTQQTGWCFVAATRPWMAAPLKGIMWWAPDDSSTSAHLPVYSSARHAPSEYAGKGQQDGVVSPFMKFDMKSSFYAFNLVANWVYQRWNLMYPELHQTIVQTEDSMHEALVEMDMKAQQIYEQQGYDACVDTVTKWSDTMGTQLVNQWNALFGTLFVKYMDGYVKTPNADDLSCACDVKSAPYPQAWYDDIVKSTGKHYAVPSDAVSDDSLRADKALNFRPRSKESLLQRH